MTYTYEQRPPSVNRRRFLGSSTAIALYSGFAGPANAILKGSNQTPFVKLNDISYTFGGRTQLGRGGVRLNSPFLGLISNTSPVPTSWTITQTSGPFNYFAVNGVPLTSGSPSQTVSASLNPNTPVPTSAGVTGLLGNTGQVFTFSVSASNNFGSSLTKTITVTIDGTCANWGTETPASQATMLGASFYSGGGRTILLSRGFDISQLVGAQQRLILNTFVFLLGKVQVKNADPLWPANISNLQLSNSTNLEINNITFGGNLIATPVSAACFMANCTNCGWTGGGSIFDPSTNGIGAGGDGISVISISGTSNCYATHLTLIGSASGFTEGTAFNDGFTLQYIDMDTFYNNNIFIANGTNYFISDIRSIRPSRVNGTHADFFQIAEGCSPTGILQRCFFATGGGNTLAQGIFGNNPMFFTGFIDDGSGIPDPTTKNPTPSGIPGNILSITTIVASGAGLPVVLSNPKGIALLGTSASACQINGNQIYKSPLAGPQHNGLLGMQGTYPLNGPAQVLAPTTVWVGSPRMNISAVLYAGTAGNGVLLMGGMSNSITNLTLCNVQTGSPYTVSFTGGISGSLLTINSIVSGFGIITPQTIFGPGVATGTQAQNPLTQTTGTVPLNKPSSVAAFTALTANEDIMTPGPNFILYDQDVPVLNTGSNVISANFCFGTFQILKANRVTPTTIDPSWSQPVPTVAAGLNLTTLGAWFVGGNGTDPKTYLESISPATWNAMTLEQVVTAYVAAFTPKTGGPADLGGGNWSGAFTGAGLWADGSGMSPLTPP